MFLVSRDNYSPAELKKKKQQGNGALGEFDKYLRKYSSIKMSNMQVERTENFGI